MNKLLLVVCFMIISCVSGPPKLSQEQMKQLETIEVFKEGSNPTKKFIELKKISAADCSGAPAGGRIWGKAEKAILALKMKAVSINADAIMNTNCGAAPLVNNCWAAKKCNGLAIKWAQ